MPLQFYNTLTRRLEEFVPLVEGKVGMYTCGPTIYAPPHIGNLRTFFFADVLHRYLEYRGYQVRFVMNLTDVDDKTIRGANQKGVPLGEYTEPFADILFDNFRTLGIAPADVYPRATHYVDGMIDLIRRLEERGIAYPVEGSVYFDISRFPELRQALEGGPGRGAAGASGWRRTSTRRATRATSPCGRRRSRRTRRWARCGTRPGAAGARGGTSSAR